MLYYELHLLGNILSVRTCTVWIIGNLFCGVSYLGFYAKLIFKILFTSCAEVKNECRHILIPMCAFMAFRGYDKISNKILKLCAQYLSQPLTYIHNTSIIPRNFPESLKCSVVVPVFKNGDMSQIADYLLISLVTGFCKIFKILTYRHIIQHIQCHNN